MLEKTLVVYSMCSLLTYIHCTFLWVFFSGCFYFNMSNKKNTIPWYHYFYIPGNVNYVMVVFLRQKLIKIYIKALELHHIFNLFLWQHVPKPNSLCAADIIIST